MAKVLQCLARSKPFVRASQPRCRRGSLKIAATAVSTRRDILFSAALTGLAFVPNGAAFASSLAEKALEREQEIEQEEEMLEYLLEQQRNARKAALTAEQKALTQEVKKAEDQLEKQLTATEAGVEAAVAKGDTKTAEALGSKEAALIQQEQRVELVAKQLQAQVDREVLVEKARETSAKQQLNSKAKDEISKALDSWLDGINNLK